MLTLTKYGDFINQIYTDPFGEYKRKTGAFDKGESMVKAKLFRLLPGVRQVINLKTPDEQIKFYTTFKHN